MISSLQQLHTSDHSPCRREPGRGGGRASEGGRDCIPATAVCKCKADDVYFKCQTLTHSLESRVVPLLTITSCAGLTTRLEQPVTASMADVPCHVFEGKKVCMYGCMYGCMYVCMYV